MKKSLVALAALAATGVYAQSTVTIDGIFDAGYAIIDYKGNKASGVNNNGSSTSQLNFRGTQDLGGGLTANFRFESDFNSVSAYANSGVASGISSDNKEKSINNTISTFGNGEVRVGLSSATLGSVDLGAVNYNSLDAYNAGQPFGTAIGSGFRTMFINDSQATSQVRADNAIKLKTPNINGFVGSIYKSAKQTISGTGTLTQTSTTTGLVVQPNAFSTSMGAYDQYGVSELAASYANGPLNVSFAQMKNDQLGVSAINTPSGAAGTAEYTITTLGANYTLGAFKLFGLNQTVKTNTASVDKTATTVSGTYTMGNTVLMYQVGSLRDNVSAKKSTLVGYGVDYNLSKTTAAYFRAESIDDTANNMNAAVTPYSVRGSATQFTRTMVGLRVGF